MKKFLLGIAIVGLLAGSAVVAQTARVKGLGFVAPTVKGLPDDTVADPAIGEIVFDKVNAMFRGFNGTSWSTLDSSGNSVPSGTISAFVGVNPPPGYVFCDGSSYSASTYPNLAVALWDASTSKYAFGGSGTYPSGSFNVPDLRGKFLRGVDGAAGVDVDASGRSASNTGGNTGNNVGSAQADALASHSHTTVAIRTGSGDHYHLDGNPLWFAMNNSSEGYGSPFNGRSTDLTGGNETRPKNVYVNYIIKL